MLFEKKKTQSSKHATSEFFFKEKGCNIHTDTQIQCTHRMNNRNRKYSPAHRKSKASTRRNYHKGQQRPGGSAGFYRSYWVGGTGKYQQFLSRRLSPPQQQDRSSASQSQPSRLPIKLGRPHLLPFSPLSPEEGTSRERLGKPLDFILLHPLNGQKTKENMCRRQQLNWPPRVPHKCPPSTHIQRTPADHVQHCQKGALIRKNGYGVREVSNATQVGLFSKVMTYISEGGFIWIQTKVRESPL